ncbi:MAG: S41 family peptidase [Halanaerobiales bacterium]|nr:S41 family peptidase [Halanaerobiales bacterium]
MFKNKKKLIAVLLILTVITVGGYKVLADELTPLNNLQNVIYLIDNFYVEDRNLDDLVDSAINGMLQELDPYSSYLSPDEYEEMQVEFEGEFGGIGIVITVRENKLTIVSPIKNTPGERAGLKAGDVIKAVDGQLTSEISQQKAVDLMRGEPGTHVTLTILRGEEEEFDLDITRAIIEVPYVEHNMETDKIGYVSIAQFVNDVGYKTRDAIKDLESKGAQALILDLRSNPGGILDEAVKVASNFIKEGTVVTVKSRRSKDETFNAKPDIEATELPVIVLINEGSASASEIVAGAISDTDRGKLLGQKTFGKGTVQTVIPLGDGSALRLTTARYYTPDGTFIHEKGIEPDYKVEYQLEDTEDETSEEQSNEEEPNEETNEETEEIIDNQKEEAIKYLEELLRQREDSSLDKAS